MSWLKQILTRLRGNVLCKSEKQDFGIAEPSPETWLVCFTGMAVPGPFRLFTSHGFNHVWLMHFSVENDRWLICNPSSKRFELRILSPAEATNAFRLMGIACTSVLDVTVDHGSVRSFMNPWTWYNCVTMAKHILKRGHAFVLTPKQLHKFLLQDGAKEIMVKK